MKKAGETQRQRKTRRRRDQAGFLYYWVQAGSKPRRTPKPRAVARALRRHPPTTCAQCAVGLLWSPSAERYVDDADTSCPNVPEFNGRTQGIRHVPANGKRPSPYWGESGGISR